MVADGRLAVEERAVENARLRGRLREVCRMRRWMGLRECG